MVSAKGTLHFLQVRRLDFAWSWMSASQPELNVRSLLELVGSRRPRQLFRWPRRRVSDRRLNREDASGPAREVFVAVHNYAVITLGSHVSR